MIRPCLTPKVRAVLERVRLARLVRSICTRPTDLVIVAEYAGPLLVKAFSNPLVVQLHGSATLSAVRQGLAVPPLVRFFERRTVALATAVTAVSRFAAEATLTTLNGARRPTTIIPNFVDPSTFHPAPDEVDTSRLLFVGKLNRLKGVFVLAEFVKQVFDEVPAATLTVVGGDYVENGASCRRRFLEAFDSHERARIRMLGRISHHDSARELRRCGVLVVPSLVETFGNVVIEAMSSGRPVVASNRGGLPELVQHGLTGLLADPDCPATFADAVIRLLRDTKEADGMGGAGREAVLATYTSESVVNRLHRFYDQLRGESQRWRAA